MIDQWQDFEDYFEIISAKNSEQIAGSQRLRFQVYCLEHAFLDARNYPNQRETDAYDERAVHSVLRHRITGELAATVRLVLADEAQPDQHFPIESCEILRRTIRDQAWRVPRHSLGEISRFAVAREFRRRTKEATTAHGLNGALNEPPADCPTRRLPHLTVGLFKAVYEMSVTQNVTHWYAVMEPSLLRLLDRFGIKFKPIGPLVDFHGLRQPCIAVAEEVLTELHLQRPEIWAFVTGQAEHCYS